MKKNTNFSNKASSFLIALKIIGFLVLGYLLISLILNVITFVKSSFPSNKSYDGSILLAETIETVLPETDYHTITDEEKVVVLEEMQKDTAIQIDDITTKLKLIEYQDLVVFFIENSDLTTKNIVFRKTDQGLVFDGSFVVYVNAFFNMTNPIVNSIKISDQNRYYTYNNYNFQQSFQLNSGFYHYSCFSYNDSVSHSIMLNTGFTSTWWNPLKLIGQFFSDYTKSYTFVSEKVMSNVINNFTSFNEKQHLMFGEKFDTDLFANFYTDIFTAVKTLNKDCLVDYTNSSYVGLFDGNIGQDDCKYYKANCYFEIDYTQLGHKAYAVNTKDYAANHVFNNEKSAIAIPKITFSLNYDKASNRITEEELNTYLNENQIIEVQASLQNVNTGETVDFTLDLNKKTSYSKYLSLGNYILNLTSDADLLEFAFSNLDFEINDKVDQVKIAYYFTDGSLFFEIPEDSLLLLDSNSFKRVTYNSVNLKTYSYDFEFERTDAIDTFIEGLIENSEDIDKTTFNNRCEGLTSNCWLVTSNNLFDEQKYYLFKTSFINTVFPDSNYFSFNSDNTISSFAIFINDSKLILSVHYFYENMESSEVEKLINDYDNQTLTIFDNYTIGLIYFPDIDLDKPLM